MVYKYGNLHLKVIDWYKYYKKIIGYKNNDSMHTNFYIILHTL